jgi:2-polyprenyl-3-methyl-5-hydroxy-6-metoxy-1,4-benzoquinol methylase
MPTPRIHSTPPDAARERVRETVLLGEVSFEIERPLGSDVLIQHPGANAAYQSDAYIPYWAELWPASRMLAKAVLREPGELHGHVLEVACGLGLAGLAALHRGCEVTFSDIDELAVRFAADNARRNHFTQFQTTAIDLRSPPSGLQYALILGADLLYEPQMIEPVVAFLAHALTPAGQAWIADPDRVSSRPFAHHCRQAGLVVTSEFARAGEPGGERTKGTIYRVRRGEPNH